MKVKIVAVLALLIMIFGSFGAVGTNIEIEKDCGCNKLEAEPVGSEKNQQHYLGLIPGGEPLPPMENFSGRAPPTFDWRNKDGKDWTTPIRNQGQCGSCYAFGSYAAMEACIKIKSNKPNLNIDLSEQYMVSCSGEGCGGATQSETFGFIQDHGAIPESCFPYSSGGGNVPPCSNKCSNWYLQRMDINSWGSVSSNKEDIKNALIDKGPLPTSMQVYANFHSYSSGIYTPSGEEGGSHLVTIVGYNENEDYWICKNSWGTSWGENGWFKIAYGVCEIEDRTVYMSVQPTADKIKTYFGQDWDNDADGSAHPPSGDWKNFEDVKIRMGEDWWPEDAELYMMFDIGTTTVEGSMVVGLYFCDWSMEPWTGGPDFKAYNWETESWTTWGNVGDHDQYKWIRKSLGSSSNKYVDDRGWVFLRVHTAGDDDTVAYAFSVNYNTNEPAIPNLDCDGTLSFGQIKVGQTGTDEFTVKNTGPAASELSWKIDSYPTDWGTWSFSPSSGSGLKGGDSVEVTATVTATKDIGTQTGKVWVKNQQDSNDKDYVTALMIIMPNSRLINRPLLNMLQNYLIVYQLFQRLLNL